MKNLMTAVLLMTATEGNGGAPVVKLLSSPELDKLRSDLKTAWTKQRNIEDMDSKEFTEAATETLTIKKAISDEENRLRKAEIDAKLADLRKAEITQLDEMLKLREVAAGKNATDEDKTAATNAYEAIVNKLLKSVGAPKPSGNTGGGAKATGGVSKSEQIAADMASGTVTYDQMIAKGFGDGTIRTVASEKKFKKNADGTYSPKA